MTEKRRRGFHNWLPKCVAITLCVMLAAPSRAVPSFARQTGMACAACHTVFPELTPFGREFKLNGYVLDNLKQITGITLDNRQTLALNALPPISLMLQLSYTRTGKALPDSAISGALAKNGDVLFPQQASLFYAGKIADNLGAFVQLTYDGVGDSFGFDNTDIRYARHIDLSGGGKDSSGKDLVVGRHRQQRTDRTRRLEHDRGLGLSRTPGAASRRGRSHRRSLKRAPAESARTRPASASTLGTITGCTPSFRSTRRLSVAAPTHSTARKAASCTASRRTGAWRMSIAGTVIPSP